MEQRKIVKEIIIGLSIVLISLFIIIVLIPQQIKLSTSFGQDIGVNTRTFPYFTAAIIGIAAGVHLIVSTIKYFQIRKKYKDSIEKMPKEKQSKTNIYGEVLSIFIFILFAAYSFIFSKFGFIIASITIPPLILVALKSKKVLHYISAYGFIALMFVIFQYLLKIQLN